VLPSIDARSGSNPVLGHELEEALTRPEGQHPDDVAQVLGLKLVQPRHRDKGHDVSSGLGVVVAASDEALFQRLLPIAKRRGCGPKQSYLIADGAEHIWLNQQKYFPDATPCVDGTTSPRTSGKRGLPSPKRLAGTA